MKKLLLIACLLTFSIGLAVAQQQGGPGSPGSGNGNQGGSQMGNKGNMGDSLARLVERLGLNEKQTQAIALIFEDSQALREEERERNRAVQGEIREATHTQIMAELTDAQRALFEEQRQQREALRGALDDLRGYDGNRGSRGGCDR